ncbi:MAG: 5-formyltetrahydrofolate cyclo-ligase [Specibacter sp.]
MSTLEKAAWRATLRARRQEARTAASTAAWAALGEDLSRAGLGWLDSLASSAGGGGSGPGAGGRPGTAGGAGPVVCAYISTGAEPPTGALLEALADAGYAVHVPVCEPGQQLSWTPWHPGVELLRSRLAPVMEPSGPRFTFDGLDSVRAILVPALAADGSGVRLGQGGGYYDRFLAGTASVPVAAVVLEHEALAAGLLPHDALDVPVDCVITPAGHLLVGAGGSRRR